MNNQYRSLILDDDPDVVEQLIGFMNQTGLFSKPTTCTSGMEAIINLRDHDFDLFFLDMELPDMPGLELLRLFPNHCPTIAVSAYPSYAVNCYDSDIADFMAKPLTYARFLRALRRTVLKTTTTPLVNPDGQENSFPAKSNPPETTSIPKNSALTPNYIFLKTGANVERFVFKEILYFEAYTLYAKLITNSGTVVINEPLSKLSKLLSPDNFIRVHKSYLINLLHVSQYSATALWLNTHKIPIGKTHKNRVQQRLKELTHLES